jgi:formylglycine-generating enzyme required for sulfatase activity
MRPRFSTTILAWTFLSSAIHVSLSQPAIPPSGTSSQATAPGKVSDKTAEVPEGMVLVPAGPFIMGSNNNGGLNAGDADPQQMVTLPAFYIDKTEVTNAEYKQYCDATGYPVPPHWKNGTYAEGYARVPVTWVNWWEAQAYAAWKGKRLPTEAEWEKAARGADGRVYPWGNSWNLQNVVANADDPHPVGSKPDGASPYGALDMSGNVFEWTSDWYMAYSNSTVKIAQFGTTYKIIRGGAFSSSNGTASTYFRGVTRPEARSEWVGFRCVQPVDSNQ